MLRTKFVATFAAALAFSSTAFAQVMVPVPAPSEGYPNVGPEGQVDIGFNINFFGNNYSQLYIYDNGYISFGSKINGGGNNQSVSQAITQSHVPIIAPLFFSDNFFEYIANPPGGGYFSGYCCGITTYEGHTAFATSWFAYTTGKNGGYPVNWYQLVLVDRSDTGAGNFDFMFNTSLSGYSNNSFSGYAAEGNFYGYFYGYKGKRPPGLGDECLIIPLGITGGSRCTFEVRDGVVTNPLPLSVVPEPQTYAMLLVGLGVVGFAAKRRRKSAA